MRLQITLCLALVTLCTVGAQQRQTFGAGVSLTEGTPLARVISRPSEFEGKTVRVEGTVTAVCGHKGCWMAFAPDDASSNRSLLVKVDDDVIVFPISAKGRRASAQGVIQRVGSGDHEAQEAAAEHATQARSPETPGGPSWQLKATGAVVY
jgi:hypothetical protein